MPPLHNAVRRGDLKEVRHLVHGGAKVNAVDGHGNTPLMLAAEADNYNITEYLLHQGAAASIHKTNHEGDRAVDLTEDDDVLELLNGYMDKNIDGDENGGDDYGPGNPDPDGNI